MSGKAILLPVLVQVGLVLVVYVAMAVAKARAARRGEVDEQRRALHADAWPEAVQKLNNNIRNQFEVPVLFYVLCFALMALDAVGSAALAAAWLFVASRVAHAYVHVVPNVVAIRRRFFMFGVLMVMILAALALRAMLVIG